ncbi:MAG: hypothetical protein ACTHLZ_09525 [Tepidisphaeraceae bacterium]
MNDLFPRDIFKLIRPVLLSLALIEPAFGVEKREAGQPAAEAASGRAVEAKMKKGAFKAQPTRTIADLPGFTPTTMPERTQYGGVKRYPKLEAKGFFYTRKVDGRWWLVDPLGYRMIDAGVAAVNPGGLSPGGQAAFDKTFSTQDQWASQTRQFLRDNGFDGTGCWSDDDTLRKNADRPLVHTRIFSFMGKYGGHRGGTKPQAGHQGYPNECIFVFDPEFAAFADTLAAGMAAYKDDPYLLGYFTDNELPFKPDALDRYLQLPDTDPGRRAADAFVAQQHVDRSNITDKQRQAWVAVVAEHYFSVVHAAIRKYDPNHMILGPRLYGADHRDTALLRVAGKYVDVVCYNMYGIWSPKADVTDHLSADSGRPVMISEFYAKAEDSGLANTDGGGWLVHTQADRGKYYQNFTLDLLQSRVAVGWHWFKYMDNDPAMASGPNPNDSNKGLLNNRFRPYPQLLLAIREVNASRYALIDYFDRLPRSVHH